MTELDYLEDEQANVPDRQQDAMVELFAGTEEIRYSLNGSPYKRRLTKQQRIAIGLHVWRSHVAGERMDDIAQRLGISEPTVHRYRQLAYEARQPVEHAEATAVDVARCETLIAQFMPIALGPNDDNDSKYKAFDRVLKAMQHAARIQGRLNETNVAVAASVTMLAPEALELQALVAQQEAENERRALGS